MRLRSSRSSLRLAARWTSPSASRTAGPPAARASYSTQCGSRTAAPLTDLHPPVLRYTNTRGQVRFPSLAAGRWQLRVQQELFVPEERILDIAKGQRLERQITLERGMRLHGKVLRPDGSPASGALLILSDQTVSGSSIVRETSAEADGSFRFTGLPRGYYLIEARRSFGIHSELARKRGLRPGPEPIELRLRDEDPPLPGTRR
jgi:hypothetical protein